MAVAELGCARDRLSALNRLLAEAVATLRGACASRSARHSGIPIAARQERTARARPSRLQPWLLRSCFTWLSFAWLSWAQPRLWWHLPLALPSRCCRRCFNDNQDLGDGGEQEG